MTLDRTLLSLINILKKYRPGEKIEADLSRQTFMVLVDRQIIDSEHRVRCRGYVSIQEHMQIHEFLRYKTLENLAVNHTNVLKSLMNGDRREYSKLSTGIRRKLRKYGLVERKNEGKRWTLQPTALWKEIIVIAETSLKTA